MGENGCCMMCTKDALIRYGLEELKNRGNPSDLVLVWHIAKMMHL